MSGRREGGQQQLLHSKFLAGFVCHIEKNEVVDVMSLAFDMGVDVVINRLPNIYSTHLPPVTQIQSGEFTPDPGWT